MINEKCAKSCCPEDISLIENYQDAISDEEKMWEIHHRSECGENGRTLFTRAQLKEMGLCFKRPASELIFVARPMHWKLHREIYEKRGKIVGKKHGKIGGKIVGGNEAVEEAKEVSESASKLVNGILSLILPLPISTVPRNGALILKLLLLTTDSIISDTIFSTSILPLLSANKSILDLSLSTLLLIALLTIGLIKAIAGLS